MLSNWMLLAPRCSRLSANSWLRVRWQSQAVDWAALSARWREDLDPRIVRLQMLRDQLDGCIGCGCLSLEACPLRNPGDQLAAHGPGAHWRSAERGV